MDVVSECRKRLTYNRRTGDLVWIATGYKAGCIDAYGYVGVGVCRKKVKAHHIAWLLEYGEWPSQQIDHINGNRADNRIENLRLATYSQNMANRPVNKANRSGFKGVSWAAHRQKWQAHIMVNKKSKYLGLYTTPEEASRAYQVAAEQHFGEFARF